MKQARWKRIRPTCIWGRGVTAAHRTFNPAGKGSSPFGPTHWRVAQRSERASYKGQTEGSTPSAPTLRA